ncbi:MAG: hypothetical protein ACRDF6_06980 [bacterium]
MCHTSFWLIVMLGLGGVGALAFADHAGRLPILMRLRDTAEVPQHVLTEAQEEVTRIYREAGVDILWSTPASLSAESNAARQAALTVAILSDDQAERINSAGMRDAVGFAVRTATEGGRVAYVVYNRVQMITGGNGLDSAQGLAIAMAHEIGHLLLPHNAHSPIGLMRAEWTTADLKLAQRSRLLFTAAQAELLRSRISVLPQR